MSVRIPSATSSPSPTDAPRAARGPQVVVALHEGFYGAESGTGFSNRAFLTALARLLPPGRLSVITPHVLENARAHGRQWTSEVQQVLRRAEAEIVTLPHAGVLPDSLSAYVSLCRQAGTAAVRIAERASRCLLVGLDVPFLGLAPYASPALDLLLVPRSTAGLTCPEDFSRVHWEREALRTATARGGHVGAISPHMRRHLTAGYGVSQSSIVSITNGLIQGETVWPGDAPAVPFRARAGFLLAMGRAVPIKGFEDLLEALRILREREVRVPHLLLAAVTSDVHDDLSSYQRHLAARVRTYGLDATLTTRFTPATRAWMHSPALRAVIVPSREEPFGRIPLEAFAAGAGPVVATTAGGLAETVIEGETGFTAAPRDPASLASALHRALTVLPRERERLRNTGAALVRTHHDYETSISSALQHIAPWVLAPSPTVEGRTR
ncbi:glycosyltransferase family 4 protein [Streptomyces sp. NBC_01795]|uniref:glycosyltransferase family 4 protein n=1 Tax=unclassified Streptomyces TaxID=2593676 RepID=UPI002DDBC481|nr:MULTISPECIES: glycosyltransferase family 4 protein [unclassified Streptomyces]WSA93250.1 glycosyltransferase family 4 protein [Streptomyces sp. NBC_01795]WSB77620.1 glycosyltransferase family 4 protein [Streptomyces sp. NBC_01775]WSS14110.1 glycosyltransferase family 4 protein [Streptomyces sp. NBC_01186]